MSASETGRGHSASSATDPTYPVSQVSLVVRDLDATLENYYRAFGWKPWKVFEHLPPTHHATELRGQAVDYTLRGAEVMVGDLNFELLQPLDGPSLWRELLDTRGECVASFAVMFKTREESEAVKRRFADMGIDVSMKAEIGDHIEYYYLDTQERFGCLIESGSGHAIDFVQPAYVYPPEDGSVPPATNARENPVTQISVVVRDLDAKVRAYRDMFGWGPWNVYQSDGERVMYDCKRNGRPVEPFDVRWAETRVGDLNFELLEPGPGGSPWLEMLERDGEGIGSLAVMFGTDEEAEQVRREFSEQGIGVTASARIGDHIEWYYLDTQERFGCVLESGSGHALDFAEPVEVIE